MARRYRRLAARTALKLLASSRIRLRPDVARQCCSMQHGACPTLPVPFTVATLFRCTFASKPYLRVARFCRSFESAGHVAADTIAIANGGHC
eukprot:134770-Pleurochrysis_carterae.AAC.1